MKIEKMTVNRVGYSELEAHICQTYGIDNPNRENFIVAMEEWNNDSDHLFRLKAKPLSDYDTKQLAKWKADPLGYHPYMLRTILIDMVNNGHLEPGNYLIEVF